MFKPQMLMDITYAEYAKSILNEVGDTPEARLAQMLGIDARRYLADKEINTRYDRFQDEIDAWEKDPKNKDNKEISRKLGDTNLIQRYSGQKDPPAIPIEKGSDTLHKHPRTGKYATKIDPSARIAKIAKVAAGTTTSVGETPSKDNSGFSVAKAVPRIRAHAKIHRDTDTAYFKDDKKFNDAVDKVLKVNKNYAGFDNGEYRKELRDRLGLKPLRKIELGHPDYDPSEHTQYDAENKERGRSKQQSDFEKAALLRAAKKVQKRLNGENVKYVGLSPDEIKGKVKDITDAESRAKSNTGMKSIKTGKIDESDKIWKTHDQLNPKVNHRNLKKIIQAMEYGTVHGITTDSEILRSTFPSAYGETKKHSLPNTGR